MPSYCRQSQRPTPITSATTISLFQLQLPSLNGSRTNRVCSNGTFAQTVRRSAAHLFSMCTNVGRARKAALRWFARLAVSQLRLLNGRPCICTFVARTYLVSSSPWGERITRTASQSKRYVGQMKCVRAFLKGRWLRDVHISDGWRLRDHTSIVQMQVSISVELQRKW